MAQRDRPFRILPLAALSLLALTPLTAEAGGKVTGVSFAPSPATTGVPVTITVTGEGGPCAYVQLSFGDGTPAASYSGPLPTTFSHTYTTTETKIITAIGVNQRVDE